MSALSDFMERVTAERDAMSKTIEEWKAASGYDDLLAAHSAALTERDALLVSVERLRAFVDALRADGLDIDDPTTAPTWTGKIHAPDGALLFDLATARADPEPTPYSAICHHQTRPDCAGCPDDAVCEASGRARPHRGPHDEPCETCGAPAGVSCRR